MLAQLKSMFWPSARSAFRRVIGWGALALFFCLWALCGHDLTIAQLALPWIVIALYYVLVWWAQTHLDQFRLAKAHADADTQRTALPSIEKRRAPGTLRVPPPLQ